MDKTRQCNPYKIDFLDNTRNVLLSVDSIDDLEVFSMLEKNHDKQTNLIDVISILEQ